MSSTPACRRSSRLAAKPVVTYAEPAEVPDEHLMEKTKAMFETLLEERLAAATRDFPSVYWRCRKEFLKLYADLPADDVERVAAESFLSKLPYYSEDHIVRKYITAHEKKLQEEKDREINAKIVMEKEALGSLIGEYNRVLIAKAEYEAKLAAASKAIATHAATLNATIRDEHSAKKRARMRYLICKYAKATIAKLRPDCQHSAFHSKALMEILYKGKLLKRYVVPKMA